MKKAVLVIVLVAAFSWAAPNPDDYPITVHVSSVQLRWNGGMRFEQRLHVTINMKNYELVSFQDGREVLAIGNYKARLIENPRRHPTTYESSQTYELLFPDHQTRKFFVFGQSE